MSCAATVSGKEGSGSSGVGNSVCSTGSSFVGGVNSTVITSSSAPILGFVSSPENNIPSTNISSNANIAIVTPIRTDAVSNTTIAVSIAATAASVTTAPAATYTDTTSVTVARANTNSTITGGGGSVPNTGTGTGIIGTIVGVSRDGTARPTRAGLSGSSSGVLIGHMGTGGGVIGHSRQTRYAMEGVGARVIRGPDWKWGKQVSVYNSLHAI